MTRFRILLALYALSGIGTFGHAAKEAVALCEAAHSNLCPPSEEPAMTGLVAGIFWPLYWSWEIAS